MKKVGIVLGWILSILIGIIAAMIQIGVIAVGIKAISVGIMAEPIAFLDACRIGGGILIVAYMIKQVIR